MEELLTGILGASKIYDSGDETFSLSRERFYLVGGKPGNADAPSPIWIAAMEGEPLSERTYNHIAFKIPEADYDLYLKRVQKLGLEVREGRARLEGEGRSIYFYDDDNHMFELHTGSLSERLACYARGVGKSGPPTPARVRTFDCRPWGLLCEHEFELR
jgi:catechol 2,3-dioxygenase-like lactoylglutathione lyase family enzyme